MREDKTLAAAHLVSLELAKAVEELLRAFPNLDVNPEEKRAFRSRLYKPLIQLAADDRARIVEIIMNLVTEEDNA